MVDNNNKPRVLICDDADIMRSMVRDFMEKHGFEIVDEAQNGREAVEKYKTHKPDLVTMDIVMPQKNGIDAVREICTYDPEAKVIMCSALGQEILVMDAIEYGAKDFIIKPFKEDTFREVISRVLKKNIKREQ